MQRDSDFSLSAIFAIVAVAAIAVLLAMRGPAPLPVDAPPGRFSAGRARAELLRIIPSDVPRPNTSDEAHRTRDRIVERFRELGYETTIQSAFACSAEITCAPVENIIARRPGEQGPSVFGVAHYDSAAAGPGISDDGAGVAAILETARVLRGARTRHPIAFLVTDGEEEGLLGARAFVADARQRSQVLRIVNLENRGTRAPGFMFETSARNLEMVRSWGRSSPRPVASSLFFSIYEMLPNDTDLSVFKRAGLQGINFAAIRDPWAYHTPLDAHARLDLRMLQHCGDNLTAALRSFADDATDADGNAAYFDVLSRFLVVWPAAWSIAIAGALLAFSLGSLFLSFRTRADAISLTMVPASIVIAAVTGGLVTVISYVRAGDVRWLAAYDAVVAASWLTGSASTVLIATLVRRVSSSRAVLASAAVWWSAFGLLCAAFFAGAAYLFIIPAAFLAAAAIASRVNVPVTRSLTIAGLTAALVLWLPFGAVLYEALAAPAVIAVSVLMAIVISSAAAMVPQRRAGTAIAMYAAAAALSLVAAVLPPATVMRPQPLNLILYAEEGSTTRWLATSMTRELRSTTPFDSRRRAIVPYSGSKDYAGDASEYRFVPPDATVQRVETTDGVSARFTLVSRRAANQIALIFRPSAQPTKVIVNGTSAPMQRVSSGVWNFVNVNAPTAVIDIELPHGTTLDAWVRDKSFGLPPAAQNVMDARTRSGGTPINDGDGVVASRHVAVK